MKILSILEERWRNTKHPFFIKGDKSLYFKDFLKIDMPNLNGISKGDVVVLVGDFNAISILTFFKLIEKGAIVAPLTENSSLNIKEKSRIINADFVIEGLTVNKLNSQNFSHELIKLLRKKSNPGLIFFSTGTTGEPKAILHDVTLLFERFKTKRTAFTTINFLMFDHMGGINTMLHTLYNCGTIISPENRNVHDMLDLCKKYSVELLPATPTFLRMLLMSGAIPDRIPKELKIISYGTELMDQTTLNQIADLLPEIMLKQTYGLSEFCVLRVKNRGRKDLFIEIGGEGVETKIKDKTLFIKSSNKMLGYLNSVQPFDEDGWYNTKDIVEQDGSYIKIIGRDTDVVNVGGLKFMKSEVEEVLFNYKNIAQTKVITKNNPITGQHIEIIIEPSDKQVIDKIKVKRYLKENLPSHMQPLKISIGEVPISHRLKKK